MAAIIIVPALPVAPPPQPRPAGCICWPTCWCRSKAAQANYPDAFGFCGCPCGCMNGADGADNLCSRCRGGACRRSQ